MLISRPFFASDGKLVDTSAKLTWSSATSLWDAGARGVIRYVFFGPPRPDDLDAAELAMLLDVGFWVAVVQHVPLPSWHADGATGDAHARAAVANAMRAGYVTPAACHSVALALDAEGVGDPGPPMVEYARAGFARRVASGYQPVGYCGYDCGLVSDDLDAMNADAACGGDSLEWWCDFAALPKSRLRDSRPLPAKGYALHQRAQRTLASVPVDEDAVLRDGAVWGLVDSGSPLAQADEEAKRNVAAASDEAVGQDVSATADTDPVPPTEPPGG